MNGQQKSKPEIKRDVAPVYPAWKEVNTEATINSVVNNLFRQQNPTVRRVDGDFRSRPDKMADRDDVQ